METLPFNACDYRCERCLATERCAVFKDLSAREARNFALGRDSDGLGAALRDVGEIFGETRNMLAEKAAEYGIDLDELADAGPRDTFEEAKKDPLYLSAFDFMIQAQEFLKTAEPIVLIEGCDFLEDITWHHTVVPAKVFRAIGSEDDPEMRFDAVNSAAVAMNSLTICIMAFGALAPLYPVIERECKELSLKAMELKQYIGSRFCPGS
ncbi:MAG: hypothetical protein AABZ15_07905 [Nitrospirota bacterium]